MNSGWNQQTCVAVGGLGGSGTRVGAEILKRLGYYLGPVLNQAQDCLLFTLLFKRPAWIRAFPPEAEIRQTVELFLAAMTSGLEAQIPRLGEGMLEELLAEIDRHDLPIGVSVADVRAMRAAPLPRIRDYAGLAWKEPNTHIFLPYLAACLPGLRYVHVIRHGLDMALSRNQAQLANWGTFLGIEPAPGETVERTRLRFWLAANRRAIQYGRDRMGERFLLLNYDTLCRDPEREIARLATFCGQDLPAAALAELCREIRPAPRHRYLDAAPGVFEDSDHAAVRALGFRAE